jgi:hypothetical protein
MRVGLGTVTGVVVGIAVATAVWFQPAFPRAAHQLVAIPVDHAEMAKHYVLSADDLALVLAQRACFLRFSCRLPQDVA